MKPTTRGLLVLLALLVAVVALGWTPPPNCFTAIKLPTHGWWAPGVVTSAGFYHEQNRSSCGGQVRFVNVTVSTPDGKFEYVTLKNTTPNSVKCNFAGCVRNVTEANGMDRTQFTSKYSMGWYIVGYEGYDYLVP